MIENIEPIQCDTIRRYNLTYLFIYHLLIYENEFYLDFSTAFSNCNVTSVAMIFTRASQLFDVRVFLKDISKLSKLSINVCTNGSLASVSAYSSSLISCPPKNVSTQGFILGFTTDWRSCWMPQICKNVKYYYTLVNFSPRKFNLTNLI